MAIINVQHMFGLRVNPHLVGQRLAHGAASVAAGIVVDLDMAAPAASGNIHPVSPRLAIQDMYGITQASEKDRGRLEFEASEEFQERLKIRHRIEKTPTKKQEFFSALYV